MSGFCVAFLIPYDDIWFMFQWLSFLRVWFGKKCSDVINDTIKREPPDSKRNKLQLNGYHSLSYTLKSILSTSLLSILLIYPKHWGTDVMNNLTPRCHVFLPYITCLTFKRRTKQLGRVVRFRLWSKTTILPNPLFFFSPYQSYENGQPSKFQLLESRHMWRPTSVHLGLPKTAVSNPVFSNVYNPLPLENITLNPKHAKKWGAKENLSQSPFSCTFIQIPTTYDQGELAVSYRWTGWVWEKTGWSSRLQENYRSFSRNL